MAQLPQRRKVWLRWNDEDQIEDGAQVTLVWGEEGGGSAKPTVERHVQVEIRATISTSPLAR